MRLAISTRDNQAICQVRTDVRCSTSADASSRRLLCSTVYDTRPEELYYHRTYFHLLPNLTHVRFEAMPEGLSPMLMDACFEQITSLDIAYGARWRVSSSTAQQAPYTTRNPLTRFTLASHCFRELVSRLYKIDLNDEYALGSRYSPGSSATCTRPPSCCLSQWRQPFCRVWQS